MKRILFLVFVVLMSACILSCDEDSIAPAGDWQITSLEKEGIYQTIAPATLCIEKNNSSAFAISGFAGVNNFFGKIKVSKNEIKNDGNFAVTQMLGPDEAMEFESDYLALISTADSWKTFSKGEMECLEIASSSKNMKAEFSKIKIAGTAWTLKSINTGNALVSTDADIFISFISSDKINGSTGINTINYGYKIDSEKHTISFSEGMITRMAGSPDEMEMESLFLQNLLKAASYSITSNTLTLRDSDGNMTLEFVRN